MTTRQVALETQPLAFAAPGSFRVERPASPKDVVSLIEKHQIQIVDLKFTDLPGLWQHFSITLPEIHQDLFSEGIGFDGSSIRGFQEIHESDMLLKPDPTTAFIDPVCEVPTLVDDLRRARSRSSASRTHATRAISRRRPRPT